MTGVLSKIWRVFEKDGRSPRKMVPDGYAEWCAQMEELEQVERLSQEFWRLDGGLPTEKKKPVRTRSAALAEKRALQARMREGRAAEARRGRRVSVGEDVTSGYGENRSPRSTDIAQLQGDELWEETATGATARAGFYESLY